MSRSHRENKFGLLVLAVVLAWTFLLGCTPMRSTDIWWHLKTGQLVLADYSVPRTDWFTYTDVNSVWIDLHWGFQVLAATVYEYTGVDGLVLMKAVCLTGTIALLWYCVDSQLPAWGKAVCLLLPIICLSGRSVVRPEMLSWLFLPVWLWIISRLRNRPRLIWLLIPLQLVWVNCHALFVLGLVVLVCYLGDRVVRRWAGGRFGIAQPEQSPSLQIVLIARVAIVLISLANPYFVEGALFPLTLYRKFSVDQALYSTIGEFQRPIDFLRQNGLQGNIYLLSMLLLWVATTISFVALAVQSRLFASTGGEQAEIAKRETSPDDIQGKSTLDRLALMKLFLFAAFSHLAWKASRNVSPFAVVSAWILMSNCRDVLIMRGFCQSARSDLKDTTETVPAVWRFWATVVTLSAYLVLIGTVVTDVWADRGGEGKRFALGEANQWYIHQAARFASQEGFPKNAFIAHNGQAAVYIFHNGPEHRVFTDGRLEVASKETYQRYRQVQLLMATRNRVWESLIREESGQLPVVILDSRYSRAAVNGMLQTSDWRLVYADPAAAVFLETAKADALSLRTADPRPLFRPPDL